MAKTENETHTQKIRNDSGNVIIKSRLIEFIYVILRDHLPAADVESTILDTTGDDVLYSNGWLARYAENAAQRLITEEWTELNRLKEIVKAADTLVEYIRSYNNDFDETTNKKIIEYEKIRVQLDN